MATTVISTLTNGNTTLGSADEYYLLPGVTHYFSTETLTATGSFVEITVLGTLFSTGSRAIDLGANEEIVVTVGANGHVSSPEGFGLLFSSGDDLTILNNGEMVGGQITTTGDNLNLVNTGRIIGSYAGSSNVELLKISGDDGRVLNSGLIHSSSTQIAEIAGSDVRIENSGTMSGVEDGIVAAITGSFTIVNSGHIAAVGLAVAGGAFVDTVINTGSIAGDVELGGGADVFDGRGGTVTGDVAGGLGDDTYIVDDATLSLIELTGEGTDEVRARTDWTLGDHFENLTLIGGGDFDGIGNDLDNALTGNSGDNRLEGEGGLDTIDGGAGNDILLGGGGRDDIMGGTGDDTLRGQVGADTLSGGDGDDVVSGNAGDDVLSGDAGADTLIGGAGGDELTGGGQSDVFLFRNASESANDAGWDTITDFTRGEDVIDLSRLVQGEIDFLGTGAFTGTGQAEMRVLTAGGGADTRLRIDLDGDGNSDMRIDIDGVTGLTAVDFIL